MADPYVDAVYIGDPTISERTMAQFGYYHQTNQFLLEVAPSKSLYLKRILGTHTNRLDPQEMFCEVNYQERVKCSEKMKLQRLSQSRLKPVQWEP